ncbi:MAG: DUF2793 domain-containing protein, partial [Pseudomonadota bacterium]
LGLPYLLPNQAQKHVTVNESLRRLDTLIMAAVEDRDLNDLPASPEDGEAWLIGDAPTGLWDGMAGRLAFWTDGAWFFETPQPGWRVYDKSENALIIFDGTSWSAIGGNTQNLEFIGLATIADAANPFSARLNAALFTSLNASDGGTGDLRLTLNKETTGNVGSILFQSGWSGRAELGLVGNDDFSIRVSSDGTNWIDSVQIDGQSGHVGIGGSAGANDALTVHGRFQATSSEGYFLLRDNGTLDMARHSGGAVYLRARSSGSTVNFGATDSSGQLTNNTISIRPDQSDILFAFTPSPLSNASVDLGQSSRVWRDLYLQNAPTVSSDARGKTEVDDLHNPMPLLEFLRPVSFRREGKDTRHFGFIAQEVREALLAAGHEDAALWTLSDPHDEESAQMLCQEELIAVLVAAFQKIIVRLEALEAA